MQPTDTDNWDDYLQHISGLDISPKEKMQLLYIVSAILAHFVDQAFGVQTDQITMRSARNNFNGPNDCASICACPENLTAAAVSDGVESDLNPGGSPEP